MNIEKNYSSLTLSVKLLCYNDPKHMKSKIGNPKSEMEGPYMSNVYAKAGCAALMAPEMNTAEPAVKGERRKHEGSLDI